MLAPWNFGSACLWGGNARITVECLNLVHRGGVIPVGSGNSLRRYPMKLHRLTKRMGLFLFCPVEFCLRTRAKDIQPGQRLLDYSHLM